MFSLFHAVRVVAAALAFAFLLISGAHAQKWVPLAPIPQAIEEAYGVAAGGKMYVFGGLGRGWKPLGLVFEYDPGSDKWTTKKPMPLAAHHTALAEVNGKIYVIGGFVLPKSGPPAWVPIDNVWEYDPAGDAWKAVTPMPTKRGSPVAAVVDGKVYVIGGAGVHPGSSETAVHPRRPHRALGTNEVYDPATNTWATLSDMPTARNHAVGGVVNNKIYVIGGRIGAAFMTTPATSVDIVEEFNPATNQWGPLKRSMPTARSAMAGGVYKGKIIVAGGEMRDERIWGAFTVVEALDPVANLWTTLPSLPVPRHGHAGVVLGNRLHIVTGDVQSLGGSKPEDVQIETNLHHAIQLPDK